jgi:hypothetical protein
MAAQSPNTVRIYRRWINTALFSLIILAVVAGFVALWWVVTLPQRVDEQQTIVVGRTRFAPDSEGSVRSWWRRGRWPGATWWNSR